MDIKDLLIQPSEEEATEDITAHRGRQVDASSVPPCLCRKSKSHSSAGIDTSAGHACTRVKPIDTKSTTPALVRTFDAHKAPVGGNWSTVYPLGFRAVAQSDIPGATDDSLNIDDRNGCSARAANTAEPSRLHEFVPVYSRNTSPRATASESPPVVPPFPRQRSVSDSSRVHEVEHSKESPHLIPTIIPNKRKRKVSDPHGWTDEDIDRVIRLMHLRPDRTPQACEECRQRRCKCGGGYPCKTCQKYGRRCVYTGDNRAAPSQPSSTSSLGMSSGRVSPELRGIPFRHREGWNQQLREAILGDDNGAGEGKPMSFLAPVETAALEFPRCQNVNQMTNGYAPYERRSMEAPPVTVAYPVAIATPVPSTSKERILPSLLLELPGAELMDEGTLQYFTKMLEDTVRHGQHARSAKMTQPKKSPGKKQGANPAKRKRSPKKERWAQGSSLSSRPPMLCPLQQTSFPPVVEVQNRFRIPQALPIAFDENTLQHVRE